MKNPKTTLLLLTAFCSGAILVACDQHHSVTKQMGWQCTGVTNTTVPKFPHIESIKLWFVENPGYEERATGPNLCAELEASGGRYVDVTFDVWGNHAKGLHGYDTTAISIGSKRLEIYETTSGGFHENEEHYGNHSTAQDRKEHPAKYRFPIDVFR